VDAILDATEQILTEQGLGRLTTNAVAELSGFSIGSIYQYFPGKDALLAELRRRHQREVIEVLNDAIKSNTDLNFEDSLRCVVQANVEVHAKNPELHYLLTKQYSDVGFDTSAEELRFSLVASDNSPIEQYLLNDAGISPVRVKIVARVCYEIVDSLTHAAVVNKKLHLDNDELVDEIICAVLGYLDRAGAPHK
jgi:AcrR family transcriptional regulator